MLHFRGVIKVALFWVLAIVKTRRADFIEQIADDGARNTRPGRSGQATIKANRTDSRSGYRRKRFKIGY